MNPFSLFVPYKFGLFQTTSMATNKTSSILPKGKQGISSKSQKQCLAKNVISISIEDDICNKQAEKLDGVRDILRREVKDDQITLMAATETASAVPSNHKETSTNSTIESLNKSIISFRIEDDIRVKHAQKLEEVRDVLRLKVERDPFRGLVVLDTIQRLGLDYHFQEEIDLILNKHYSQVTNTNIYDDRELYKVSLSFRLLRQHGYCVPPDVFENFKGENGKFEDTLRHDTKGLVALYEASQLSIGEAILEEAASYSRHLLKERMEFLDHDQARVVNSILENSYQNCPSMFKVTSFIETIDGCIFQEVANMDLKIRQATHRRDLCEVSRWWNDLGLAKELKLARNQIVKWYIWPMAALADPCFSEQRIELTKVISLIYIIDDIFDVYGTLDELTLFTEAVKRWHIDAGDELPNYMKNCYKSLYKITNDISSKVDERHGFNPTNYLQNSWVTLIDAFLVEAKWFAIGKLPKANEYLRNGILSTGVHVVLVHMFFLLGDGTSRESAIRISNYQGIISSVATILRLWDDLGNAKDENQDGCDGSYLKCYLKENEDSSIRHAREHVMNLISDKWKHLNKECLSPNAFSTMFTKASLNLASMIPLMYSYNEDHSLPLLQEHVKSMLGDDFGL